MSTQLLLRIGIIEKISIPGERRHFYRISSSLWENLFLRGTEHVFQHLDVVERGLKALEDEPREAKGRLLLMKAFLEFFYAEVNGIAVRWQQKKSELLARLSEEPQMEKEKGEK